ncbi:regulatory protein RecX [Thermoanaerobacter kivui]|uniref:Regulatory protein RecX n=1 Tax=Thermoanaerobacter kivui TaxID=2325 RepID=A0A097ARN2_THEKI|nr:regulatory protein RecX [Thermoanaerobacter kivui]AIS52462.1 regulatory protein RecX [Thermoanaerobacter kivui]
MVITLIEKQKKNLNKYNIYIDGKYAFSCTLQDLNHLGIEEGMEIDSKQYNYYVNYFAEKQAKEYAFKLLSRRMLTEHELLQKLKLKQFPDAIIEKVIEKLKEYNYLNDEMYTKLFIEQKMNQHYSKLRIFNELLKRGVYKELIQQNLNNIYTDEIEIEVIKKIAQKKLKPGDDIRKFKSYLYRNGFQIESINSAFRKEDL